MLATKLLYLEDMALPECIAEVVDVLDENGKSVVILDQTIFYPQGGGQPYDKGTIQSKSAKFNIEEVRWADGIVKHVGVFENDTFEKGYEVTCIVDKDRRALHSRIHSAGHVIDMAVTKLNYGWIPGKGFHYPEGPYIEYSGTIKEEGKEKIRTDIETEVNRIVQEGRETTLRFMEKNRMHEVCHFVPDYIPEGKPSRVVMYGDFGVPCGGTHVGKLSDIRKITVRKVKQRRDVLRVAYDVEK